MEPRLRKPPRVAHATTAHPATDNRILRKECQGLSDGGFDVCLIARSEDLPTYTSVTLVPLPHFRRRWMRMLLAPMMVLKALISVRPQLLHVHDPELIPIAAIWRFVARIPVIYDAHEDLPKQVAGKEYVWEPLRPVAVAVGKVVEWMADRFLDAVVAATPSIAANYRHARTETVQNFPWLHDYPEPRPIDDSARRVVYVGGVSKIRGVNEMYRAVRDSRERAQLTVAGVPLDSSARERLNEVWPRVDYVGRVDAGDVPELIGAAMAGLVVFHPLPNHTESQPTKIFEYMAAGRAVIASDFEYWRELIGPAGCAIFVDPLDSDQLRRAIDHVIARPEETAEMGSRARRVVVDRFSFDSEIVKLQRLTLELLE